MSAAAIRGVVRRLGPASDPPTDAELVSAFAAHRDPAAFAELVRRHGPTVLGVCRRVLADAHDAEDAFQAVFLVLARRAAAVRPAGAVAGWLYGVAVRTANKARVAAARRRRREMNSVASRERERPESSAEVSELRAVLDAELAKLPDAVRAAVVLCDLHGKTRAEAAAELGCPEGTVAARLHRGRKRLADALTRRGLALPAAGLAAVLTPVPLSAALSQSALALASGTAPAAVAALAHEVIRSMTTFTNVLAVGFLTLLTGGLLAAGALLPGDPPQPTTPTGTVLANAADPAPRGEPKPAAAGGWREAKVLELVGWLGGSAAYSADGKTLFVGGTDGHARAYDAATFKQLWEYKGDGSFAAVATASDNKTVAATFSSGEKRGVQFLDAATGKAGDTLEESGALQEWPKPIAVAFFPDEPVRDGDRLIATSRKVIFGNTREYVVKSWIKWPNVGTVKSSTVAAGKNPADDYAVPVAVAPDGKRVVVTGPVDRDTGKNVLWAWSAGSGAGNQLLQGHKAPVTSAAWSKDGKLIVTGDADGVVITWDAAMFKEKSRVNLGARVAAVAVTDDGRLAAAAVTRPILPGVGGGAYAEEVLVWPTANAPEKPKPISSEQAGAPFKGVASLAFAPDGKTLVSAFCNFDHLTKLGELRGKVRVFATGAAKPAPPEDREVAAQQKWTDAAILTDHGALVNGVAVAPDGKSFAAATDRGVTAWDSATRKPLWTTKLDAGASALAFSGDSRSLYVAGGTELVRLDAASGKKAKLLGDATGVGVDNALRAITGIRTRALALSPDGKRLAGNDGYSAWMIEPEKPENYGTFSYAGGTPKDAKPVPAGVAWSPDGKVLATINPKHTQRTFPSGLTPDTHWPVRIWTISGTGPFGGLFGHDDPVTAVAWSKDGKVIASGDEKGVVILWDAATGKELWRHAFEGRDDTLGRVNALAISPLDNTVAVAVSLGSGKGPERVVLLDPAKGEDVGRVMRWSIPVSSVAWSPDGKILVTGCGEAGAKIARTEPPVGEVVVWERKP